MVSIWAHDSYGNARDWSQAFFPFVHKYTIFMYSKAFSLSDYLCCKKILHFARTRGSKVLYQQLSIVLFSGANRNWIVAYSRFPISNGALCGALTSVSLFSISTGVPGHCIWGLACWFSVYILACKIFEPEFFRHKPQCKKCLCNNCQWMWNELSIYAASTLRCQSMLSLSMSERRHRRVLQFNCLSTYCCSQRQTRQYANLQLSPSLDAVFQTTNPCMCSYVRSWCVRVRGYGGKTYGWGYLHYM